MTTPHAAVDTAHPGDVVSAATYRDEIHTSLDALSRLLPDVQRLTDTYQRGRGFLTPEGRLTLDRQTRAERHDLRAQPERLDPVTGAPAVGLDWLNRTTLTAGTGDIPTPGNFRGIACEADITWALADHCRRVERTLRASNLPVPAAPTRMIRHTRAARRLPGFIGPMPPVTVLEASDAQPTADEYVARLRQLVDAAPSPTLLAPIARDLARLVEQAELVVEGNDRTNWTERCPYCGEQSLIHYLRANVVRCETDPRRHSSHPRPCVCPDSFCPCKTNPTGHRHEWAPNPDKSHFQRSLWQLQGDVTRIKENHVMETRAQDAVAAVRALHTAVPIHRAAQDCPAAYDEHMQPHDHDHEHVDTGNHDQGVICLTCPPAYLWCTHCTHPTDSTFTPWPCDTLTAIEAHAPQAAGAPA